MEEYESSTPYHRKLREDTEPSPNPFTPTGFDESVDLDAIIQETPKTIIRLLRPVINSIESANLHVLDGLNESGGEHHFDSAKREIERARRGVSGALSQLDTYLTQIEVYLGRQEVTQTPKLNCSVCGKAAQFREENSSTYYCGSQCHRKRYQK